MSIRSKVIEFSLKYRKQVDDKHSLIISEITRTKAIKLAMTQDANHHLHSLLSFDQIDDDLDKLNIELDSIL
jgi:hypothetical protein